MWLDRARKKLLEIGAPQVDMKWTNTGKKIYDKLPYSNHNTATTLLIYKIYYLCRESHHRKELSYVV